MTSVPFCLKVPGKDTCSLAEVSTTTYRLKGRLRPLPDALEIEWTGSATVEVVGLTGVTDEEVGLPAARLVSEVGRA